MILTQAQIEAETRSKWGGKFNKTSANLLTLSLASFELFVNQAMYLWPEMRPYIGKTASNPITKQMDGPCCEHHTTDKVAGFSPQKITGLERAFRQMFGDTKANDLLNIAARWQLEAMSTAAVSKSGGYWATGYYTILTDTFQQAHSDILNPTIWEQLKKRARRLNIDLVPPMPLVVTDGSAFIQDIYANGYELVTSKITKLHLPRVQQIMTEGLSSGLSWQEIAGQMHDQLGQDAYHWTRLVRSEMVNASQQAKIEQAKAQDGVNIQWSASRMGATCKVCLERNGKIFDPHKMNSISYFATAETQAVDAKRDLKIGRYPHPQCRCALVYTVLDANWNP